MKVVSKMSFRRPRTRPEPPKEVEVMVASPCPVFRFCTPPAESFLFPVAGVVADVVLQPVDLPENQVANVTLAPAKGEGQAWVTQLVENDKPVKSPFLGEVAAGDLVAVKVEGPISGVHVGLMFYPGLSLNGYETKRAKAKEDAGS